MKWLKRITSWTIWSLLGLYIAFIVLIHLPGVQTWIGDKVSAALTTKLGSKTSVGRVDLGFLNRIIIDDLLVHDLQSDTLLNVDRVSARIEILPLLNGKIAISSAQLFGATARLYQADSTSVPNYQFVLDALSSADTTSTSSLDLRINSLILRRCGVSYDRGDVPETPGKLNKGHLDLRNISAHVVLKALTPDSLNVKLKRLAFSEQSGLTVNRLSARVEANGSGAILNDFRLQMPQSSIETDSVWATYDREKLVETLCYGGSIRNTKLCLSDYNTTLNIDGKFTGTAKSIAWEHLDINADDGSFILSATGDVDMRQEKTVWNTRVENFHISTAHVEQLCSTFPDIPGEIARLGDISMKGEAYQQSDGSLEAATIIRTDLGQAVMMLSVDESERLTGRLDTDSLHLGHLLDNDKLGVIATHIDLNGRKDSIGVNGRIDRLGYDGYTYRNIDIDGAYQQQTKAAAGHIIINDPCLTANLDGLYGLRDNKHGIRLTGVIEKLNPEALNLTDRWPGTVFSAVVDADICGSSLNDLQGTANISDFVMRGGTDTDATPLEHGNDAVLYSLNNLHVESGYADNRHFISINGDMGQAEMSGQVPDNFDAEVTLTDTKWMEHLLGVPLAINAPLNIRLSSVGDSEKRENELHEFKTRLTYDGDRIELNALTRLQTNGSGKTEAHISMLPSHITVEDTPWHIQPCNIHYSEKRLEVDSFVVAHGGQHLIVNGTASASAYDSLVADLRDVDVAYVLDLVNFHAVDFSGLASGRACATQLFSSTLTPLLTADLQVSDFRFLNGRMGTLHAKAEWNDVKKQIDIDAIADDSLTVSVSGGSPIGASRTFITGYVSPVRSDINLDIRAENSSVDFCRSFTHSFLSNLSGFANGRLRVAGPLKHINLTGSVTVDGQATVTALGTTYSLRGDTVFMVPNDIQMRGFRIYDSNGNIGALTGGIHHDELSDFTFDIDVAADKLLAYDFPEFAFGSSICGSVRVTGDADMHGRPGEIVINCDVTPAAGSFFAYNAANPDAISKQEFITWGEAPLSPPEREASLSPPEGGTIDETSTSKTKEAPSGAVGGASTDLHINFLINTTPEATLRVLMDQRTGDYITLNGTGTMRASFYNKGPFHIFGTYNVDHGTYGITIQNILKKNFTFQPGGTIVFGGDPYNANLNLKALYTVNGVSLSDLNIGNSFSNNTVRVNCLMNIQGTPGQPRVDFDLEMPTVNSEENQMIRSVIASEQEMNQQVLYLLGIGRFYTQGVNNANMQQYDQTTLAMQSFLSGTVSTQINEVLSQVIKSSDWNFGANISTGNEGWHNAEYEGQVSGRMLNNRLLINGQFGYRDNATQATPSFIGDFDIRYLLNPNGNFAVKAYNQTNDRYFTRSSLNTQGIGLIMKRDFQHISDLFRPYSSLRKNKK